MNKFKVGDKVKVVKELEEYNKLLNYIINDNKMFKTLKEEEEERYLEYITIKKLYSNNFTLDELEDLEKYEKQIVKFEFGIQEER